MQARQAGKRLRCETESTTAARAAYPPSLQAGRQPNLPQQGRGRAQSEWVWRSRGLAQRRREQQASRPLTAGALVPEESLRSAAQEPQRRWARVRAQAQPQSVQGEREQRWKEAAADPLPQGWGRGRGAAADGGGALVRPPLLPLRQQQWSAWVS